MNMKGLKRFSLLGAVCLAGSVMAESTISISVQETEMRDVLKFISEQSGSSIVISPDISTKTLDISLQDVLLSEALDVILKPYGCGYRKVGKTIVVDKLENLDRLSAVEPLVARVITLKYLDADGVSEIVDGLLSERGSVKVLRLTQELGWAFSASGDDEDAAAGKLERQSDENQAQSSSKTLVVSDTPSVLTRITDIINEIDIEPRQIEIRSYFVEFSNADETELGVNWGMYDDSGSTQTGSASSGGLTNFMSGTGFDLTSSGMLFGLVNSGDTDISLQLSAYSGDEDTNILSAPRIVTQENQEATILVGEKYPIITSESDGDSGDITISLDYFERIGIQLNVIPKICEGDRISMVIHPAVTDLGDTVSASIVSTSGDETSYDTPFPRITTREAETRLTVDNGATIAIGGLVSEEDVVGEYKVPFLGDIPYLGRLFRQSTTENEKTELVILMSATILGESPDLSKALEERVDQSAAKLLEHWEPEDEDEDEVEASVDGLNVEVRVNTDI